MSSSHLSILLLLVMVCEGVSQTSSKHSSPPRFTDEDIRQVLHDTVGVPPEFGADIRLTIVELGFVGPRMRRALLNEAYSLAGGAQERVALKRVDGGGPITGALNDVFQKGFDELSLRARVSEDLVTVDADRAQDLFRRIKLTSDEGSACEQEMVYDPSIYYSAMARLLASISASERRVRFLEDQIPQLVSTAQVASFVRVVIGSNLSLANQKVIAQRIAAQLSQITSNRRVFSSYYADVIPALTRLATLLPKTEQTSFLIQLRDWILASINDGVCQLQGGRIKHRDGTIQRFNPSRPSDIFNNELTALGRVDLAIDPSDVSASPLLPPAANDHYSSEYLSMFRSYHLLATDYGSANTEGRWQSELQKYTDAIDQWNEPLDRSQYSAYYIEKADILQQVLSIQQNATIVRTGMTQSEFSAIRRATSSRRTGDRDESPLHFLLELIDGATARDIYPDHHLLWFQPVLELLRSSYSEGEVDASCIASSNPVLRAYGALSRLLHSKGSNYI